MNIGKYISLIAVGSIVCLIAWLTVVNNIDPFETNIQGFIFFYATLFLWLCGMLTIIFFIYLKIVSNDENAVYRRAKKTFLQGITLSLFIILILIMLQNKLLNWWTGIVAATVLTLIQAVLFTARKHNNTDYV